MLEGQPNTDYNVNFPPPPAFESPNCSSTDPEIFFPRSAKEIKDGEWPKAQDYLYRTNQGPRGKAIEATKTALAICMDCVHMSPCRDYAVTNLLQFGIWGGTTYRDRLALSKLLKIEETGEPSG